jgi:hypothetical protein
MGGEGGGGVVNRIVNNLEKSKVKQKVSSKFAKHYGKRGVQRDGLIKVLNPRGVLHELRDYVEVWARESCQ